jgi:hypothetical protein
LPAFAKVISVDLEILLADSVPATLTAVATGVPNEITLSWARVTGATAYRVYQTTDITVQLAIAPPELLKVMFLIAEPIIASWFTPAAFARLGASVVPPADEVPHAVIVPSAKPMEQSQRGVTHSMEAQVCLLVVAILRFIQLSMPLLPLKPMEQSQRGVTHAMEAQVRLLCLHRVSDPTL